MRNFIITSAALLMVGCTTKYIYVKYHKYCVKPQPVSLIRPADNETQLQKAERHRKNTAILIEAVEERDATIECYEKEDEDGSFQGDNN